jgi:hypothetical protein
VHAFLAPCRALLFAAFIVLAVACARNETQALGETSAPQGTLKIDLATIFPPGKGRDLVLDNCQNCHTFVPIVVLQMDQDAWRRNSLDHRERVTTLTDGEFKTLYDYLSANFGPDHPVPTLPEELLKTWTSY